MQVLIAADEGGYPFCSTRLGCKSGKRGVLPLMNGTSSRLGYITSLAEDGTQDLGYTMCYSLPEAQKKNWLHLNIQINNTPLFQFYLVSLIPFAIIANSRLANGEYSGLPVDSAGKPGVIRSIRYKHLVSLDRLSHCFFLTPDWWAWESRLSY